MMNFQDSIEQLQTKYIFQLLKEKEKIIFDQLASLVKDGVLTIEETEPVLTYRTDSTDLCLSQAVRLTFNGEKVLNEYRQKVVQLEAQLEKIKEIIKG